jgi:hypothetical protein
MVPGICPAKSSTRFPVTGNWLVFVSRITVPPTGIGRGPLVRYALLSVTWLLRPCSRS